ncbi:hypothetical protein GW793_01680 [bacterium]|nr:hypothetical protein [bacterium]
MDEQTMPEAEVAEEVVGEAAAEVVEEMDSDMGETPAVEEEMGEEEMPSEEADEEIM